MKRATRAGVVLAWGVAFLVLAVVAVALVAHLAQPQPVVIF
jgi:hypothetical protein